MTFHIVELITIIEFKTLIFIPLGIIERMVKIHIYFEYKLEVLDDKVCGKLHV